MQLNSSLGEYLADQKPPVAFLEFPATAENRDSMVATSIDEAANRTNKRRFLRHRAVERVPLVVVLLVTRRSSAERITHEHVANRLRIQVLAQLFSIEMRDELRVWVRTNVNDELNSVRLK